MHAFFSYWFQSGYRQQWESLKSDLANGNIWGHWNPNSYVEKKEAQLIVVLT